MANLPEPITANHVDWLTQQTDDQLLDTVRRAQASEADTLRGYVALVFLRRRAPKAESARAFATRIDLPESTARRWLAAGEALIRELGARPSDTELAGGRQAIPPGTLSGRKPTRSAEVGASRDAPPIDVASHQVDPEPPPAPDEPAPPAPAGPSVAEVTIRLPAAVVAWVDRLAGERGETRAEYLAGTITRSFERATETPPAPIPRQPPERTNGLACPRCGAAPIVTHGNATCRNDGCRHTWKIPA